MASRSVDALVDTVLDDLLVNSPVGAVELGLHERADELADITPAGMEADHAR